jgi:dTDP-4-dehydrorhamnose reductase
MIFLDIADTNAVRQFILNYNPTVIYLPASLSNVDYCELHPKESSKINVQGVMNFVNALKGSDSRLVYFSSDYIFDGIKGPYSELDAPNPICEYGRQKLISEQYISQNFTNYLICRSTVVYSWEIQGKNFVQRLVHSLRNNVMTKVPIDQIGTPTYAPNLIQVLLELVHHEETGVFNIVGPELISRYEFAKIVAKIFDLDEQLIIGIETKDLNQPAKRPYNGGLIIDKVKKKVSCELIDCLWGLKTMKTNEERNKYLSKLLLDK